MTEKPWETEQPQVDSILQLFAEKICESVNYELDDLSTITGAISASQSKRDDRKKENPKFAAKPFFETLTRFNPAVARKLQGVYRETLTTLKQLYPSANPKNLDILNRENSEIWGQQIGPAITSAVIRRKGY